MEYWRWPHLQLMSAQIDGVAAQISSFSECAPVRPN
jgi:hypothetical protein